MAYYPGTSQQQYGGALYGTSTPQQDYGGHSGQPVQNYPQQQQYPQSNQPPAYPPSQLLYQQVPPVSYPAAAPWNPAYGGSPSQPYPQPQPYGYAPTYSPPSQPYPQPYGYAVAAPTQAYTVAVPGTYAAPYGPPVAHLAHTPLTGLNYCFQFKGVRLDRKDVFSKSDPFLILLASKHPGGYLSSHQIKRERHETKHNKKFGHHSGNWVVLHRTETIHNCQSPLWQPFVVNLYTLCGGNLDTHFKVEVWDSDSHSNHDFIGSCVTTVRDLQVMREIRLINKRRIGIYNSSGQVEVLKCAPA